MSCGFCGFEGKNKSSLSNHIRRCKNNPDRKIETCSVSKRLETNIKLSKKLKNYYSISENRDKHSSVMKKAVLDHPESYSIKSVAGRAKTIEYKGIILKGTWELIVAEWLDENKIEWTRPLESFEYFWNGKNRRYFPDFFLVNENLYLEVKGYERDRDLAKWKSVKNLKVLKLKDIENIKNKKFELGVSPSG